MNPEFWQPDAWLLAIAAIMAPIVSAGVVALITWLYRTYRQFAQLINGQAATNRLLRRTLRRIDKHESRLNDHDTLFEQVLPKTQTVARN